MGDVRKAEELYSIPDGVQIFFIERQEASVPTYPTSLRIFRFKIDNSPSASASAAAEGPPAFLQVGDWVYPLLPGQSPALAADYGAYLFPNASSDDSGKNKN